MKKLKLLRSSCIIAAIGSSCFLSACASNPSTKIKIQTSTPFVFRSLDLKQRRADGVRDWELTSPEARYNTAARTVRARIPKGILYFEDKPSFMISAEHATLLNDGELVVLEGSVRLKRLGAEPLLIQGDRLIWRPALSTMEINQRPSALNRNSKIISKSLIFQQESGQLLFNGLTKLSRWQNTYSSIINPQTVITAGNSRWNLNSGVIASVGPVVVKQMDGRRLTAASIQGNTKKNYIDLKAPVQFKLEEDDTVVNAGETRWYFERDQLLSKAPVSASLPKSDVSGVGFFIDIPTNTFIISSSCQVEETDKSLRAQSCSWNWRNDLLTATGNVNLNKSNSERIIRAEQLETGFNRDGSLRLIPTKNQVKTQIKLQIKNNKDTKQKNSSLVRF